MASSFPTDITERNNYILQKVQAGEFEHFWHPVVSGFGSHSAVFQVSSDALKIDGIRVNVSAYLQQQIADIVGGMLLTAKLADLLHSQAEITIEPLPRQITDLTSAMIDQSQKIDAQIEKKYPGVDLQNLLISTTGKSWLIDNALDVNKTVACNYGWHVNKNPFQGINCEVCASLIKDPKTNMYYHVIQGRGTAHNNLHVDYSQICCLISHICEVDGNEMSMEDVLQNPELAPLASHQGVLHILRQPGVPIAAITEQKSPEDNAANVSGENQ